MNTKHGRYEHCGNCHNKWGGLALCDIIKKLQVDMFHKKSQIMGIFLKYIHQITNRKMQYDILKKQLANTDETSDSD